MTQSCILFYRFENDRLWNLYVTPKEEEISPYENFDVIKPKNPKIGNDQIEEYSSDQLYHDKSAKFAKKVEFFGSDPYSNEIDFSQDENRQETENYQKIFIFRSFQKFHQQIKDSQFI